MRNLLFLSFILFFTVSLFLSCANTKPPTGGPRDTLAPVLIYADPEMGELNFKGNEIELEFDEFVEAPQLFNKLIITPTIQSKFKSSVNRRSVIIRFNEDEPFEENTTYTLNFQDAIVDITEKNPTDSNRFVFSTGDYLDSLYINGKITNLMTGKVVEEATVALYNANDTLNVFEDKPLYFGKTTSNGVYSIENIKNGRYLLFAFKDQNKNLTLETNSEAYGFYGDTLNLDNSIDSLKIPIQKLNVSEIFVLSKFPTGRYFEINFNKAITDFKLDPEINNLNISANLVDNNKKLRIYNTFETIDSLQTILTVSDSIDQVAIDTFYVKFQPSQREPNPLTLSVKPATNTSIEKEFIAQLKFSKPVESINFDSIYFRYDSLNVIQFTAEDSIEWSQHQDQALIYKSLFNPADTVKNDVNQNGRSENISRTSTEIMFNVGKGAFMGVENDSSESKTLKYSFKIPEQYGSINGSIDTYYNSFIVQLLNNRNDVVSQIINVKNFIFNLIEPGEYRIRVLVDENNNGEWDPGNIKELIEPEKVMFYRDSTTSQETLLLKANWELKDNNINF